MWYGHQTRVRGTLWRMSKRNIRVTKWLGTVPTAAICTSCNREFKVPLTELKKTSDAQQNLQMQFDRHKCVHANGKKV